MPNVPYRPTNPKLYKVYRLRRIPIDDFQYVVYKWEHGERTATYYPTFAKANANKDYVCK